jgi:hypothetical protein
MKQQPLASTPDDSVFEATFEEMTRRIAEITTLFAETTGQIITALKPVFNAIMPLEVDIDVYYRSDPPLERLSADEEVFEAVFNEMIEAVTAITAAFLEATGVPVLAFEPQLVQSSPLAFDVDVHLVDF